MKSKVLLAIVFSLSLDGSAFLQLLSPKKQSRIESLSAFPSEPVQDTVTSTTTNNKKEKNHVEDQFIQRTFESLSEDHSNSKQQKELSPAVFPLSLVVNHESVKQALMVAAANPRLGRAGVLIGGGHGTAKSVMARAAISLFPQQLERISASPFNEEPLPQQTRAEQQPLELDSYLWDQLHNPDATIHDIDSLLGVEHIPMPFVTVPLHANEEALLGSVDIEKSMEQGQTVFSPGLLAKAHRGILYIDDLHLLEEGVANNLMNALSDGKVVVEREGMSVHYPCQPALVIATYNPEEGDLSQHLMDRFAITISSDVQPLSIEERVKVVENVEGYQDRKQRLPSDDGPLDLASLVTSDDNLQQNIAEGRILLDQVRISSEQILYLCEEATRADCEGQRGELMATEIAKTVAALQGRTQVTAEDLQYGVQLAIVPRAQVVPMISVTEVTDLPQSPSELQPIDPDPDHVKPDEPKDPDDDPVQQEEEGTDDTDIPVEEPDDDEDIGEETDDEEDLDIPTEFMFGADLDVPVDPQVLHLAQQLTRKGKGGKHAKIFSTNRGRFVKAIFPKSINNGRLAIGATLRAAAPHQKARLVGHMLHPNRHLKKHPKVLVTKDDFRIQRLARKAGSLVVFVVDASGSMALNRMGSAKGAAILLLREAYRCRDKIALVEFHGRQAAVLVPPTKSMALTSSRLESLPCGGGSPLAHALELSVRLALNELKVKQDVGHVVLVLLTDGRANVPLSESHDTASSGHEFISSDRKALKEEVIALTKQLSAIPNLDLLCVDTEDQFVGTGVAKDIAQAALGSYQHLGGPASTNAIHELVREELRR